jgi:cysteine synthase/glycine/D-amino acid oxidase-like deaminating enzyme
VAHLEPTNVPFLKTLDQTKSLPFEIPQNSFLADGIGNTPMLHLSKGIFAKLEGHNPGGSVKDRTLSSIVLSMFKNGSMKKKGDTLALVTSGSAGMSLTRIHDALRKIDGVDLNVVIVMPKAYAHKPIPAEIIDLECTTVFTDYKMMIESTRGKAGSVSVLLMDGVFMDVLAETKQIAKHENWMMLDQHYDANSMDGHKSTALEIALQCPGVTDVVCATGTGATAAGLLKHLPSHVRVHSRPAVSGSIDGLSDVDRYKNFCNTKLLHGYRENQIFEKPTAVATTEALHTDYNVDAGPSSGATYWLAKEIMDKNPKAKIVFICADGKLASSNREKIDILAAGKKALRYQCKNSIRMASAYRNPVFGTGPVQSGIAPRMAASSSNCFSSIQSGRRFASTSTLGRRNFSSSPSRNFSSAPAVPQYDCVIIGGGPVGGSAAWFLAENEKNDGKSILLVHDPQNKGAHEDWSRLARLSFDGPMDEFTLSQHACSLLDMADEVRSYQSGEPVVPLRPGMLFLASPGTNLARACTYGLENFGDEDFKQVDPAQLGEIYPGNAVNLPADTLCFTHPTGYCVSPLELAAVGRGIAQGYGVEIRTGRAQIDMAEDNMIRVTLENGEIVDTRKCFLFAGAQGKKIVADAVARSPDNAVLEIPEFEDTYITAISTVRYKHRHHPSNPVPDSGHVVTPITLGQLDVPDLCPFQANFSVVAEEYGDVLKTRLSGAAGREVIDTVADLHQDWSDEDAKLKDVYQNFFGHLFPYLETEKPLDFNRCVTYRNHNTNFSGTSLLEKVIGEGSNSSSLMTTPGCFGVGVKFGPALGQAAAAHTFGDDLEEGMNVFRSGSDDLIQDFSGERIERAW